MSLAAQVSLEAQFKPLLGIEENVAPYLIDDTHPLKIKLDRLFGNKRVSASSHSLEKAGFQIIKKRLRDGLFVVKHPKLQHYVLKIYIDAKEGSFEWEVLKNRVEGALLTQQAIDAHGWGAHFIVPKKWIYRIPDLDSPCKNKRKYLLVAEEIDIYRKFINLGLWKSSKIPEELLQRLSVIMQEVGLSDSSYPNNVPFTLDGKVAFVDTEYHSIWPINHFTFIKYMHPEVSSNWHKINQALE